VAFSAHGQVNAGPHLNLQCVGVGLRPGREASQQDSRQDSARQGFHGGHISSLHFFRGNVLQRPLGELHPACIKSAWMLSKFYSHFPH